MYFYHSQPSAARCPPWGWGRGRVHLACYNLHVTSAELEHWWCYTKLFFFLCRDNKQDWRCVLIGHPQIVTDCNPLYLYQTQQSIGWTHHMPVKQATQKCEKTKAQITSEAKYIDMSWWHIPDCAFEGYIIDSPDDVIAEVIDPTLTVEGCNQVCSEQSG